MARIGLVAGTDPGHALPAIGLGAALVRRGHAVRMWSDPRHLATATANGVALTPLSGCPPSGSDEADLGQRLWRAAAATALPLSHDLQAWAPDLVVVDTLTMSGAFAAQRNDLPWVELTPHHLVDPADDLPPVGLGRTMPCTGRRRRADRRIVAAQRRSLAIGAEQAATAAASIGLSSPQPPELRLFATLPGLERPRASWPHDAHVVGPLAVDPDLPELPLPPGDEPLVLVADSTAESRVRSIAEVALRGLRGVEVRVVATSSALPPRRASRVTVGVGPHGPLLRHASLVVSPGGGGLLAKAAAAGVPQLVIPLAGDQPEAAARLRDTGAGRVLLPRHLGPARLRWKVVRHLADPAATVAAARLADEARRLGPATAAALVEAVLAGERPIAAGAGCHLGRPRRLEAE